MRASLSNAPAGEYTVEVEVARFQAVGHPHGDPPQSVWGTLAQPGQSGSGTKESCKINSSGTGVATCDLTFKAGVFAGLVELSGKVDVNGLVSTSNSMLEVRVPSLFPANVFAPTNLMVFVRSNENHHTDAESFWLSADPLLRTYAFAEAHRRITRQTRSNQYSLGLILSLNDMSLPWGGKFDLGGAWSTADRDHQAHRRGESVDINRGSRIAIADPENPGSVRPGGVVADGGLVTLLEVLDACDAAGGVMALKELALDGLMHCEF